MGILLIGIFFTLLGFYLWDIYEKPLTIINIKISLAILCIVIGGICILLSIDEMVLMLDKTININQIENLKSYEILSIFFFIFAGSVCYTIASYYHLKMNEWSFFKALIIAIPFVIIEYQFSLRGISHARTHLKLNAIQITLITMCFYFINAWILNFLILKQNVSWWRETCAFLLICGAFLISTQKRI